MRKNLYLTGIIISMVMLGSAVFAQNTISDQKKIDDINAAIREKQATIARIDSRLVNLVDYSAGIKKATLEIDSIESEKPETETGRKLQKIEVKQKMTALNVLLKKQKTFSKYSGKKVERDALAAQIIKLEAEKNAIFQAYITDTKVPTELSPKELRMRDRGFDARHQDLNANREERIEYNSAKREDLTFRKLENNPVYGDSSGFMGIISNQYFVPVIFRFKSLDGGENKELLIGPGKIIEEKLIPGTYEVTFWNGSRQIGTPSKFTVDAVITKYDGAPCHWWAYQPRF
ncbi:MAG: hypothetical protein WC467_04600 [Patescibacteria group bacterium]